VSRTVKNLILEFYQKRDSRDKNHVVIDDAWLANVSNLTGSDFTKVEAMAMYHDARLVVYNEFEKLYTPDRLQVELSGIIKTAAIVWTQSGSVSTAPKPTNGYLGLVDMHTAGLVEMEKLRLELSTVVRTGANRHYAQSASRIFIFEEDTQFKHYGTFVPTSGGGTTYELRYYRLFPWLVTEMEAGTVVETINDQHHRLLIEVMLMLSNQYGGRDVEAFIRKFVGAK
jgi:hypothetical protein